MVYTMCREDINYTCLRYKKCGPLSVYSGVTIANENTSIAGSPSVGLDQPADIIVDKPTPGVILASDASKGQVVRFYDRTSITNNGSVVVRTWTSGYSLNNPYVPKIVAGVGSAGNPLNSPYFDNHRILKYAPNATNGIVIAGNGSSGNGSMSLNYPCDSYLDEQNSWLYVADVFNNRIQRFSLNASLPLIGTTVAGNNGYGSGSDQLKWPYGVWVSSKTGAVYIADSWNNRIQRWDVGATSGVTIAGNPNGVAGNNATMLNNPYRITANANETFLYITDTWNKRIQRFPLI
ncbi:hypothetical protein I4U23_012231 [Adineta vaga]|nr:hypothetical protein I4U23_012231 [Adineta vaga]